MNKIIISLLVAFLLIGGFNYWGATKEVYGDSCGGYDWTITTNFEGESTEETTTCVRCDYKFNPRLITEGFDFRQRYLGGCKDYFIEEEVNDMEEEPFVIGPPGNQPNETVVWWGEYEDMPEHEKNRLTQSGEEVKE